ncbi:MAG: hypothetical protein QMB62_09690 [Oscillospiraceae bacterium]
MAKLNDIRFKDLIKLEIDDCQLEHYCYGKKNYKTAIKSCCVSCEQKYPDKSNALSHILYGTTTQDYLGYLKDSIDTDGWNNTPVMFVFENPGKCPKDDFALVQTKEKLKKVVWGTWPYIGWDNKNRAADFDINSNFKMKKYGELICATILHYKLKNAYVTNLVKCGTDSGANLNSYCSEIVDNCINTIFMKEFEAIKPEIIFAFSKNVYWNLKQLPIESKIEYLPHPASYSITDEARAELLKTTFDRVFGEQPC